MNPVLVGFMLGSHGTWQRTTCPIISAFAGTSALARNAAMLNPSVPSISNTRNRRSANRFAARSTSTTISTGSLMTSGSGIESAVCSAMIATGSSQQATTLLLSMAMVPSCGPSGSLKSYAHCPGIAVGSEVTAKKILSCQSGESAGNLNDTRSIVILFKLSQRQEARILTVESANRISTDSRLQLGRLLSVRRNRGFGWSPCHGRWSEEPHNKRKEFCHSGNS